MPCPSVIVNGNELGQLRYDGEEACRICKDLNGQQYDNYSSFNGTLCVCIDGYRIKDGDHRCTQCEGNVMCKNGEEQDCADTYVPNDDYSMCGCVEDQGLDVTTGKCVSCAQGKYKPGNSLEECACLWGTEGESTCENCVSGRGRDPSTPWNVSCVACPAGKYQTDVSEGGRTYNFCEE